MRTVTPLALGLAALALASLAATAQAAAVVTLPADLGDWACTGACGAVAPGGDIGASPTGNAAFGYVTTFGSAATNVSPIAVKDNSTGTATNGSTFLSAAFGAANGDQLGMFFNYVSTDGKGFDDFAWARVVNASDNALVSWLFSARSTNSGTGNVVPGNALDNKAFDPDEVITDFKDFKFTSKTADDPVDFSVLGDSNGSCWEENAKGCGYTGWLESIYRFTDAGSYRVEVGVSNWGDTLFDSALAFDFTHLRGTPTPTGPTTPVPEPDTLPLLASGLGLMGLVLRRRQSA
jgi:hypothetical protein